MVATITEEIAEINEINLAAMLISAEETDEIQIEDPHLMILGRLQQVRSLTWHLGLYVLPRVQLLTTSKTQRSQKKL